MVEEGSDSPRSDEEEGEEKEASSSCNRQCLGEVDDLLKTIHTTLNIEDKAQLSLHDKMYQGMGEVKHQVFPVHKVLAEAVKRNGKTQKEPLFFQDRLK